MVYYTPGAATARHFTEILDRNTNIFTTLFILKESLFTITPCYARLSKYVTSSIKYIYIYYTLPSICLFEFDRLTYIYHHCDHKLNILDSLGDESRGTRFPIPQ